MSSDRPEDRDNDKDKGNQGPECFDNLVVQPLSGLIAEDDVATDEVWSRYVTAEFAVEGVAALSAEVAVEEVCALYSVVQQTSMSPSTRETEALDGNVFLGGHPIRLLDGSTTS